MTPSPSSAADPAWPDDAVEVGRIIDAWGVKGWIKVLPFASDPQALFSSRRWFLRPREESRPARSGVANLPEVLKIAESREHGEWVVARAHDVVDRSGAEALRGARIFVPRSSFPTRRHRRVLLGRPDRPERGRTARSTRSAASSGCIDTGAHSVLRVQPEGAEGEANERLIPFVAQYVDEVSLEQRRIRVDWGLDY